MRHTRLGSYEWRGSDMLEVVEIQEKGHARQVKYVCTRHRGRTSFSTHIPMATSTPEVKLEVPSHEGEAGHVSTPAAQSGILTNKQHIQHRVSLFDPNHIPSLHSRITKISKLLVEASDNAKSLSVLKEEADGAHQKAIKNESEHVSALSSHKGPDIALGATTDDDTTTGYETALSLTVDRANDQGKNMQPTELAKSLVTESTGLREAFVNARRAIDSLEGGDMDLAEQEKLIDLLENYSRVQR